MRAREIASEAANWSPRRPGTAPCSSRLVELDIAAIAVASEVMLTGPLRASMTAPAPMSIDGDGLGLRVAEADQLAAGLTAGVGHRGGVDADGVVGQHVGAGPDRDLRLRLLHQHLERQGQEVGERRDERIEQEVGAQGGQPEGGCERPILGLGDQEDAGSPDPGVGPDADLDPLGQVAGGHQVLDLGRPDAPGAEDDVAAVGQLLVGGDRRVGRVVGQGRHDHAVEDLDRRRRTPRGSRRRCRCCPRSGPRRGSGRARWPGPRPCCRRCRARPPSPRRGHGRDRVAAACRPRW